MGTGMSTRVSGAPLGALIRSWAAPAGPGAPHATAATAVRGEEKPPWKEDEPALTGRWGLARKRKIPVRSGWAGCGEKGDGPREKK